MGSQADTGDGRSERTLPIPFDGVIDAVVIHDLHGLFRKRVFVLERLFLVIGVVGVPFGGWLAWSAYQESDISALTDSLVTLFWPLVLLAAFFELRKGWARCLTGQEISGGIHGSGIVVTQLDDRAAWSEYKTAWVGEHAALLFIAEAAHVPRVLALDGLPLHENFFDSVETWMRVRQLIRDRVPNIRMVGL